MRFVSGVLFCLLALGAPAAAQQPTVYRVAFTPEHHFAEIEVTFPEVPAGTLETRMSRSSPGRYAVHEYSKNVFELHAYDGKGKELAAVRPNPYQWNVSGHDGTVRIVYKIYGDHVDGTYLAIDPTHAHMNMPATFLWARGFDRRPIRITFAPPKSLNWVAATQLFPTSDPWTFTAPNLQYLFDSPTELSAHTLRHFTVKNPDGRTFTIRTAVHAEVTARTAARSGPASRSSGSANCSASGRCGTPASAGRGSSSGSSTPGSTGRPTAWSAGQVPKAARSREPRR